MADKVQLIKQEIEKEMRVLDLTNDFDNGRFSELNHLKLFINSLPKEPVSEDLEEAADNYAQQHNELLGFDCDCEPIQTGPELKKAVIFGAEWQKQQMMKDAVEGIVKYEIGSAEIPQCDRRYQVLSNPAPIANAKLGDKVKIIIIEED